MKFHSIRLGGRPVMEVPDATPAVRRNAVRCYPGHTRKRYLLRWFIGLGFELGLFTRVFAARVFSHPDLAEGLLERWTRSVAEVLNESILYPTVVWPASPARGRLFCYFLNSKGQPLVFGKLALSEVNNVKIRNEAQVLREFTAKPPQAFRVPELVAAGACGDREFVVTRLLPSEAVAVNWGKENEMASVLAELNADGIGYQSATLPWWKTQVEDASRDYPEFFAALENAIRFGGGFCRVHGDLNRTNVLRSDEELWLIDWEQSSPDGPCRADEVCVEIDRWWNENNNPTADQAVQCLNQLFHGREEAGRWEVIVALAFLHSLHFFPATKLIEYWQKWEAKCLLARPCRDACD